MFTLPLAPEKMTRVGQGPVSSTFLGIPTSYDDEIIMKLLWTRNSQNIDQDGRVLVTDNTNRAVVINVNFDFTQREYTILYKTFSDVFQSLGALKSALSPFFQPLFILLPLYFLYHLANITRDSSRNQTRLEFMDMLKTA